MSAVFHLYHHLAETLAGSHKIGGIYGLVSGDQKELFNSCICCSLCQLIGTHNVIFNSLIGAVLHQGHMLMGSGMIDHVRLVLFQNCIYPVGISHGTYKCHQIKIGMLRDKLLLYGIGVVLIYIKDDKLLRLRCRYLTTQLRTNGAAASCNHHHPATDMCQDLIIIYMDLIPAQKVSDINILKG